jgi:SAM-dependent methyltransferase
VAPDPAFDSRLWDAYSFFFDAEERRIFPTDDAELSFLSSLRGGHPGPCLEMGSGSGRLLPALSGGPLFALEPSAGMLSLMERGGAPAVRATGQQMPFRSGAFSLVVFACNGLHCILDRAGRIALLSEAARVLEPGGRLLLETCPGFVSRPEDSGVLRYDYHDGMVRLRLVESVSIDWEAEVITFDMSYASGSETRIRLDLALIGPEELLSELDVAGLEPVDIWGDYDRSPHIAYESPRMLTLAARRESS